MSDKVLLTVVALLIGFASFAATGAATSMIMAQVQERSARSVAPLPAADYAQTRIHPQPLLR